MPRIILIAHNTRSCHNVGSLLRTAEGLGVARVYLTGYAPYPQMDPLIGKDPRLPHIATSSNRQISKTALGAETMITWEHHDAIEPVIAQLRLEKFRIVALEQTPQSISLPEYDAPEQIALIVGREVEGIEPEILALTDVSVAIPMLGQKESFNVVQAAAMALYHCRFKNN